MEQAIKDEEKKRSDYKAGRQVGISGREMFYFNPELAMGDGKISFATRSDSLKLMCNT